MLFPKKYKSPEPGWKNKIWQPILVDNREKVERPKKAPKPLKKTPLPPPTKPINQIWKRKTERAKLGSQAECFSKVWKYRDHKCEMCGDPIPEPLSFCFAHRLWKWRYPEFIFEPRDISLVCSEQCHHDLDVVLAHHDQEIVDFILKKTPAIFKILLDRCKKLKNYLTSKEK